MTTIVILIVIFWFLYMVGDKFPEQAKALLTKATELVPTFNNIKALMIITIGVMIIILLLALYFRIQATQ